MAETNGYHNYACRLRTPFLQLKLILAAKAKLLQPAELADQQQPPHHAIPTAAAIATRSRKNRTPRCDALVNMAIFSTARFASIRAMRGAHSVLLS